MQNLTHTGIQQRNEFDPLIVGYPNCELTIRKSAILSCCDPYLSEIRIPIRRGHHAGASPLPLLAADGEEVRRMFPVRYWKDPYRKDGVVICRVEVASSSYQKTTPFSFGKSLPSKGSLAKVLAILHTWLLILPSKVLAETCEADNSFFNMPLLFAIAMIGATVGGLLARQRRGELKRLNDQLRQINAALRRQAKIESYAPNLSYAPVGSRVAESEVVIDPRKEHLLTSLRTGKNYLRNQNLEKAFSEFKSALELAEILGDHVEAKKAARGLGRQLDEPYGLSDCLLCQARLIERKGASLQRQGKYREAIKYHKMVLNISEKSGENSGVTEAYGAIADCFTELGELEQAGKFYDKVLDGNSDDCFCLGDCENTCSFDYSVVIVRQLRTAITVRGQRRRLGFSFLSLAYLAPAMERNEGVRFVSSSIKIPQPPARSAPLPFFLLSSFPFACQSLSFHLDRAKEAVNSFLTSLPQRWPLPPIAMARTEGEPNPRRHGREDEERVLISEVLIRNKDGETLERADLEAFAAGALKSCRPNSALTVREVQEDVHRIIQTGLFSLCTPVAFDTRDGIRLEFQVEPNQEFRGLICEGANVLPSKFMEDAFRDGYGKIVNIRHLDQVSYAEILSGGIIRLEISEAEVNNIIIRFLDRKTGEPTNGKTKQDTILQQLTTKKGQVYSRLQGKRDVETILTMGIMEDVTIIPQPAADPHKVDLVMNLVERPSGGFSAGGGISSGITSGPLSGLIGSFAYSHRNVFGRNQKLNLSLERGQIDSIFRINYTDPWIQGDNKRTSRMIMIQNSRTPGTLVHGNNQFDHGGLTIGRITAGVEYSQPFRPKWSGTAGLIYQRAGARDDHGEPIIRDFYNSPLTASGNAYDEMLIAKLESVYTDSGDRSSSMFVANMEQGLPLFPEWLCFNRISSRARQGFELGPVRFMLSVSGGHVFGNFSPHEAFAIGGTNNVRGYEEGAVGSGRSYAVGSGEISCGMYGPLEGVLFADYGSDLGSGPTVPGDPAGARGKPGSGCGYGVGIRVDSPLGPLRLEYAFNDKKARRFHFGVGYRN
ncbi:hypothetical protein ZIOFF_020215 [Zingiber officinale]|uniref:POTRA domain-containing protein n=1 Tax=Zingiber officinale TaxID=94328 RepID=A0A8J5HYX9_ZINOF|nr:hypothetical protein ZIOFF_020215 [Zingiber officinale]